MSHKPMCSVCGLTYSPGAYLDHVRSNGHAAALAKPSTKAKPAKRKPGR